MGNEEGVSADNPDLVDAWDFEVKGDLLYLWRAITRYGSCWDLH
jgi:hypothetical protein